MIYTSYFAKLKKLPDNIIPISICGKAPDWYTGLQYKKLAPKYDFFMKWKENHDNDYYIKCFKEQVLDKLTQYQVMLELQQKMSYSVQMHLAGVGKFIWDSNVYSIALICYEKPGDFCHRHLVADWLKISGVDCEEWRE